MKIDKKYFVGKNKPGVWASIYVYKPSDSAIFAKCGEIFAGIAIEGPKDLDASLVGNLLLDILHETYFESEKDSVLAKLEEAVKAVQRRLISLIENDESLAISGVNFDLITLVVKKDYAFSVKVGEGVLKIFRDGNLQDLSAAFKDPTGEKQYSVLSMLLQPDDRFFLATPASVELYDENEIFESVADFNELILKNKMLEDDSRIAFLLLGVDMVSNEERDKEIVTAENSDSSLQEAETFPAKESTFINVQEKEQEKIERVNKQLDSGATPMSQRRFNIDELKEKFFIVLKKVKVFLREKYLALKQLRQKRRLPKEIDTQKENLNETTPDKQDVLHSKTVKSQSTFNVYMLLVLQKLKIIFKYIKVHILGYKDDGKVYVGRRGRRQANTRVIAIGIVVIVVIFILSIRWRNNAIQKAKIERENKQLVQSIETEVTSLQSNSIFQIQMPDNVADREKVLTEIDSLIDKINTTTVAPEYKDKVDELVTKLYDLRKELLRIIDINSDSLFVDLGANFEGASLTDIAIVGEYIYVSDNSRNVIYKIDTNGNVSEISKDFQDIRLITNDPDGKGLIILDSSSTALGLLNTDTGEFKRFVGMSNDKLASVSEMDAYEVGKNDIRLYMATSTSPQVQYINKRGSAYNDGPKKRWETDELNGITDIALLNGKFIFTKPSVGILRYYVNSQINTTISGLIGGDSLSTATKLDVAGQRIYVADSVNNRVLVFTAGRESNPDYLDLIAQYKADSGMLSDIKDIAVGTNSIYVLDDSKIHRLDLSALQKFDFN